LPDAEDRDLAVGVPAQAHAPGLAADIEEDLTLSGQGNGIRLGHVAYRRSALTGLSSQCVYCGSGGPH